MVLLVCILVSEEGRETVKGDAQLVTVLGIVESRGYPRPRNPLS